MKFMSKVFAVLLLSVSNSVSSLDLDLKKFRDCRVLCKVYLDNNFHSNVCNAARNILPKPSVHQACLRGKHVGFEHACVSSCIGDANQTHTSLETCSKYSKKPIPNHQFSWCRRGYDNTYAKVKESINDILPSLSDDEESDSSLSVPKQGEEKSNHETDMPLKDDDAASSSRPQGELLEKEGSDEYRTSKVKISVTNNLEDEMQNEISKDVHKSDNHAKHENNVENRNEQIVDSEISPRMEVPVSEFHVGDESSSSRTEHNNVPHRSSGEDEDTHHSTSVDTRQHPVAEDYPVITEQKPLLDTEYTKVGEHIHSNIHESTKENEVATMSLDESLHLKGDTQQHVIGEAFVEAGEDFSTKKVDGTIEKKEHVVDIISEEESKQHETTSEQENESQEF